MSFMLQKIEGLRRWCPHRLFFKQHTKGAHSGWI